MNQEHPKVCNTAPIEAYAQLPAHRICICPPSFIFGLSHQNLLVTIHEFLTGEYCPLSGFWLRNLIDEAIYRGLLFQTTHGMSARTYQDAYPVNLEQFMQNFSLREGWNWVPQQREHK